MLLRTIKQRVISVGGAGGIDPGAPPAGWLWLVNPVDNKYVVQLGTNNYVLVPDPNA